jgi:hypothetical protein
MAPTSKQLRPTLVQDSDYGAIDDEFDFGDPEVVDVEIYPGKFLSLHEPTADDLIAIEKVSNDPKLDDVEQTLAVICILHHPGPGKRKLSMKDAKRLRAKQIQTLNDAMRGLMGTPGDEEDSSDKETPPA